MNHSIQATVLVIDDSVDNLAALSKLLDPFYQVRAAPSGELGLRAALIEPRPDVILLDVMMPEMDGYAVLARLRQNPATADIPVIFLTALADAQDEEYGLELGAADYITKPLKPVVVLARVRTQLEAKRARDLLCDQNALLEQRLVSILDSVDAMLWSADAETSQLTYISSGAVRLTGHTCQELLSKVGLRLEMILPEDRARFPKALAVARSTGVFECEYRIAKPGGALRWVSDQGRVACDSRGQTTRIDGVAIDVTHRRVNEIVSEAIGLVSMAFLRRREPLELYGRVSQFLSNQLCFPIAAVGLYNPVEAEAECFGFAPGLAGDAAQALPGLAEIVAAVTLSGVAWVEADASAADSPRLDGLRELGGRCFLALPLSAGETVLGALVLAGLAPRNDVQALAKPLELVAHHLALELDREHSAGILDQHAFYLRKLIDGLHIFVGITTPEGVLTDVNLTALRVAGLAEDDVIGQPFEDTYWWSYSPEAQARLRDAMDRAAEGAEIYRSERVRLAEDRFIVIHHAITPLRDPDGAITHLIHSGIDITERFQAEDKVCHELRLWAESLGIAAHSQAGMEAILARFKASAAGDCEPSR